MQQVGLILMAVGVVSFITIYPASFQTFELHEQEPEKYANYFIMAIAVLLVPPFFLGLGAVLFFTVSENYLGMTKGSESYQ